MRLKQACRDASRDPESLKHWDMPSTQLKFALTKTRKQVQCSRKSGPFPIFCIFRDSAFRSSLKFAHGERSILTGKSLIFRSESSDSPKTALQGSKPGNRAAHYEFRGW